MRSIYSLLFALFLFTAASAQTEAKPTASLQLKELEYDFGKIPQGKPVYHFFELVNKSDKPLKIQDVHASCGCTTPEWSKEEVAPGGTTQIKVGYNAAAEGAFEKYITVQTADNNTQQIKIKGMVWKAPAGAAPVNASVQFLKQKTQ